MKRDFLTKELGLSKEITDKIMAQYGESVNSLKTENQRLSDENAHFCEKLQEAEGQNNQITQLTQQNSLLEESVGKLTLELNNEKINGAVSQALISAGAKNLNAAGALIDTSKITFENDEIGGLYEQIEAVKKECGYLFYAKEESSGMRHASSLNNTDGFTSYARAAAKIN